MLYYELKHTMTEEGILTKYYSPNGICRCSVHYRVCELSLHRNALVRTLTLVRQIIKKRIPSNEKEKEQQNKNLES